MTTVEWGRVSAPAARAPQSPERSVSLVSLAEYGVAGLLLLLLSQALLAPLFNPAQDPEGAGWLRTMWLPVYGVILALVAFRLTALRHVAWGAALAAPLLLLALVSSEWSILPDVTVRRTVALGFTTLFGLWLAARFSWREIVGLVAAVSTILAIGSYLAALFAPEFGVHSTIHPGAWRGLWYEKNTAGAVMARGVLACGCAALMLPAQRWFWLGGAALCAGLVLLSTSTTSLLALLLVGAGFVAIAGLRRGGAVSVATMWIGLVGFGVAGGLLAFAPDLVFDVLGKDATLTGRTDIWGAVLRQVEERPMLGYGFGAFWEDLGGPVGYVRNEVDWSAPTAHNGWLELLLSFGWIGVLVFGVHLLVTAGASLRTLGRGPEAYWALLSLALFVLFSMSESTIMQQNNLSWALYVMTGAKLLGRREAVPIEAPVRQTPRPKAPPPRPVAAWSAAETAPAASRLSFAFAVGALLILSRTWLPVFLGGEAPSDVGGRVQIVYIFAYLGAGMLALSRPGPSFGLLVRAPLLLVLLGLAACSLLWSISPGDTAFRVVGLVGTTLAGVALAARFSWSELTEVFATVFAIVVAGCLAAGLFWPEVARMASYDGAWRGLFSHKNGLGGAMAAAVPVFVAAGVYNRGRLWLWGGFAAAGFALLLLSASMTALLSVGLGLSALAVAALVRRGGAAAVAATYAVLLSVLGLALAFVFAREGFLDLLGKDATLTGRTGIWEASLRQIQERPWFGFGYGALWNETTPDAATAWIFREARHEASHAHNSWLEIWLGVGLLGVVAFTLLLLKAWMETVATVYRHGAALVAAPFMLAYTVTAVTESVALTYNDLRWAMFVAIVLKLSRWGQDPMARASDSERLTSA